MTKVGMNKKTYSKILSTLFILGGLIIGVFLVQKAVRYFSGASDTPADLVVDLYTNRDQKGDAWRNLAQGGESRERMLLPVIPQIKSLKPEYIRIDHVFDYYDQNQLDELIRDITATGAKPFIALSYMPPNISRGGDVTDLPKNWVDWENKVRDLIAHVSGRGGLAINNVYYEVWNEPDLFGKYKVNGDKSYLELYLHSARGAARAGNTLSYKFGGPATTGYYSNWINSLIDYTQNNNLRLDFISWHRYSKNLSDFEKDVTDSKAMLSDRGIDNLELIISEMGANGANDPVYDNYFGAIHELATNVVLQGNINKAFTFEIKDGVGDKQYWGRWGLYTNEKFGTPVAKPRVSAFNFLNSMIGGTQLNVGGQGSFVRAFAKKFNDKITRILVVNYDPAGKHNEMVPIKITNLSFPEFTFKRIDYLGGTSSEEVSTVSATWATNVYLKPNTASIFEITAK